MQVGIMWQDYVMGVMNLVFVAALVPTLLGKDKPHMSTSLLNGAALLIASFTFSTLSLWFASITAGVCALEWLWLARQKLAQKG